MSDVILEWHQYWEIARNERVIGEQGTDEEKHYLRQAQSSNNDWVLLDVSRDIYEDIRSRNDNDDK